MLLPHASGNILSALICLVVIGKVSHGSGCAAKICFYGSSASAAAAHKAWSPSTKKPTDDILLSRHRLFCSGAGLMFPGNSLENMLFVYTLPPPQLSQSQLS